jgi:guanylate kinase
MMSRGNVFVVSAPSGAGKTSLLQAVLERMPALALAVSYTTRPQRSAEVANTSYRFVSVDEFVTLKASGAFLESAEVFGNHYATSRDWVMSQLEDGRDVVLELDWQGALQVKAALPDAVLVFIVPPRLEQLAARLQERGQDDEAVIERRLAASKQEISQGVHFDYLVVNADFSEAVADLCSIFHSYTLRYPRQQSVITGLLDK